MLTSILDDVQDSNEPIDSKKRIKNDHINNGHYYRPQKEPEDNEYQIETNQQYINDPNQKYMNNENLYHEYNNSPYYNNSKFVSNPKIPNINNNKNEINFNNNINNPSLITNNNYNNEFSKINYEIKDYKNDNLNKNEYYIKYVILNRQGFEFIHNRNYISALSIFQKSYGLARDYLKEELKEINSLINISICQYYNGNFSESYTMINKAKIIYDSIQLNEKNISSKQRIQLILKLFINSSLANLSVNNYNESKNDILFLISTIRKETKLEQQFLYFRTILFTLFKVESLTNTKSWEDDLSDNSQNSDIEIQEPIKIINHLMKDFLFFLKENDYDNLIKTFKEASQKYKRLNDFNGYYFSLFYYYLILYNLKKNKSGEIELENIKKNISNCSNNLIGNELISQMKEKDINKLLKEFTDKINCASEIFQMLEKFENELNNKLNEYKKEKENFDLSDDENNLSSSYLLDKSHLFTNERINSPIFVKLLLRYSIYFLEKQKAKALKNTEIKNQNLSKENYDLLLNEVALIQKKIESNEINIDNIKLHHLDKELINSLKQLFDNLIYIYSKSLLYNHFKKYIKEIRIEKVLDFLITNSEELINGLTLVKINYKTSGHKIHIYNIDENNYNLNVRNKRNEYPNKSYNIKIDIIKVLYGIKSPNLISKLMDENINDTRKLLRRPWNIFSIITKSRSIDLYCEDNQTNSIYYGLKYFFIDRKISYKMNSTSYFVLNKIKLKIAIKIQNKYLDKKNDKSKIPNIIKQLLSEKAIQTISFTKLMLIYNKYK